MQKNSNSPALIIAGVIVVLAILERYFYFVHLIVHGLVDIFAGGRSSAKVGLFLFYTLLLCVLVFLPKVRNVLGRFSIKSYWLLTSIGVTFAYSLSLLFIFFHKWGFKVQEFVVLFNNGEISSTMLLHNHLMKGINASLLGLFGKAQQENVDTGLAFIGLLPSAGYLIGAVLVLICAVLLILKFVELYQAQTKGQSLFIIIYSIVSFGVLKNMLDGGILNREAPVALAALILILLISSKKKTQSYWWALAPIVGYGMVVFILEQAHLIPLEYFYSTLYLTGAFALVIGTLIFWQFAKFGYKIHLGILLMILSLAVLYRPLSVAAETYFNSRRIIGHEGILAGLYETPSYGNGSSADWKLLEDVNDLTIYEVNPKQPTRINEILRANHLVGNLRPISLPGISCERGDVPDVINFTLITTTQLPEGGEDYKFGRIIKAEPLSQINDLYRYKVIIHLDPCSPRPLNIVQEVLKHRGLNTFFITNISEKYVTN